MTNLDSILKSRDITLPTKGRLVEAIVFPVVMYGCESWTIKKVKRQRIDAFELSESPLDCKEINQSILKEISPELSLEGLMLKLKLPILWLPHVKNWLIWKDMMLGKIEGGKRRGWQSMRWLDGWMASPTQWTWVWVTSGSWGWTGRPGMLSMESQSQRQLSHWSELIVSASLG